RRGDKKPLEYLSASKWAHQSRFPKYSCEILPKTISDGIAEVCNQSSAASGRDVVCLPERNAFVTVLPSVVRLGGYERRATRLRDGHLVDGAARKRGVARMERSGMRESRITR